MVAVGRVRDVLLIGLDGAMYYFVRKLAEEGLLLNLKALMDDGVHGEAIPCPPTDTPTNWTTIATGATTTTHGVTSFYIHIPGEPFEVGQRLRSRGQLSRYCMAEYIWQVADRRGVPALVLNYPAGWPGGMRKGYVCLYTWSMPEAAPRAVAGARVYTLRLGAPGVQVVGEAEGLESVKPVLTLRLPVEGGLVEEPAAVTLYAFDPDGSGYRLAVPRGEGFEILEEGEWSGWIRARLKVSGGEEWGVPIRGGEYECLFKVKLLKSLEDGVRLERSEVFTAEGWIDPGGLEEEVLRATHYLGEEAVAADLKGRLEYDIWGEEAEYLARQRVEAVRLARIAAFFKQRIGWRLCLLHYHLMDSVNHRFLGYLYREFPFYDEDKAEAAWRFFEEAYKVVDEFVGLLLKTCATRDTLVVVVSDHAALPAWRAVNIRRVFVEAGLLRYRREGGSYVVDWASTRAFPWVEPLMVWVNMRGRDPQGVVEPREYENVREEVIDLLQGLRDPESGDRIATMVMTREEAENVGMGGERAGDVVYFLRPPYTIWCGPIIDLLTYTATDDHLRGGWLVRDQSRVTGIHGYYLPNERVGDFSNSALLIMRGPGVARGVELRRPVRLTDVAPTICHLLEIPPPRDCEGRVIHEALE
ncbi:MAG: hypothetical protein DRJ96_06750 [Thermoprotei archaeon]|nr:MAG: hypothetical protein DRJ96_06750 [Thermoprotei archaeon]